MVLFVSRRSQTLDRTIWRRTYSSEARKRLRRHGQACCGDGTVQQARRRGSLSLPRRRTFAVATSAPNDICTRTREAHWSNYTENSVGDERRVNKNGMINIFAPVGARRGSGYEYMATRLAGGQTKYIMYPCRAINGKFLSNFLGPLPPIDAIFAVVAPSIYCPVSRAQRSTIDFRYPFIAVHPLTTPLSHSSVPTIGQPVTKQIPII